MIDGGGKPDSNMAAHSSTTGMIGGGFYNANSEPQMAAIAAILPWLDEAVTTIPGLLDASNVAFADFGCSEGGNSIQVMRHAISSLRKVTDCAVQTVHSDLPTNDFSTLLRTLRAGGQSIYADPSAYSSVVPGSMFDQLLLPGSLDLATTFNAIGFLSKRPLENLPDYILPNGPGPVRSRGSVSTADRSTFSALAEADVASFLEARAAELRPGGKVLLQVFGGNDEARTCDGIYDLLNDAVLDHVDSGDIDQETYVRYYQPVYFRNLDELVAPLRRPGPISDLFTLNRAESYEVPVAFVEAYKRDGDLDRYAQSYVDFFRAFTEAVLRMALSEHPDLDRLVAQIYTRAKERLREKPEHYPFRYVAIAALMSRNG
ncbi:hypothetical protein [uncultured Roseibium sp.]|uniref:hypothetical protein n=1 Tax=uncultured Roseibium sp. TaxID=1936171 RepID=UPI003216C413